MTKLTGEAIRTLAFEAGLWRPMVASCRTGSVQSWLLSFGEMPRRQVIEIFAFDDVRSKIAKIAEPTVSA